MATHQSLVSSIRLQTGMSMRELAAIWQVSPATLTLSLQGKRPRPAGLTECLAVATVPMSMDDRLLHPQDVHRSLPESLAKKVSQQQRRLKMQAEALRLKCEKAEQDWEMMHTRCQWLPLLLLQPVILADSHKLLAANLALRRSHRQCEKAALLATALRAKLQGVEAMLSVWANH